MFKKLALSTRFLALAFFVLIPFFWHSNEIEVNAAPGYEPVARTSLTLTQPAIQSVLPTPTWPAPQTDLKATALPDLQPTLTQTSLPGTEASSENVDTFQQFVESVVDGQAGVLRGVYVEDVLALKVIQQPADDPLFVSGDRGIATQFQSAAQNGITGILAHNYLSGELFFQLKSGQQVQLVYGEGRVARYIISEFQSFQKLEPSNPRSRFIDLNTGGEQSAAQVFRRVYTGKNHVTFQTCIKKGDEWSWGLIFVIATPIR